MKAKPPKQKTCKVCKEKFTPSRMGQKVCSIKCAKKDVEIGKKREFKKETRKLKEKIKRRSDWLREAQAAFNQYIRLRDKGKPCISCGKPDDGSHQRHASHYRSVGACSSLRFNTFNVHASCAQCNSILSGNLIEYRIRLEKKVGKERLEFLESENGIVRYDIEYLKRLKKIFSKRARIIDRLNMGGG